ncbi:probable AGP3-Protein of the amino-acid permease family [Sporisorium reilianum f. sp. reilianum]|uniref:Probable AGP3-Protein of the amino-acid permease family n=1 Tax=Sporisorium reilianum f. sp. reilianum TaxID=72559 RepID=A0A2N8UJY7_9BASI|nr:probable AGP3-Protein of the amino-acid permease family [Sporisorium reilianum f. sp. reilianum]
MSTTYTGQGGGAEPHAALPQTGSAFQEASSTSQPSSPGQEDVEKSHSAAVEPSSHYPEEELRRALNTRHMVMIAIGGIIGPGLLVGSGQALANAGPVGALIAFAITGGIVYFVLQALGEMATLFAIRGSFVEYAGRWVDPALGFVAGWVYWELWISVLANEYNAVAIVVRYWDGARVVPSGAWIAIFWVLFMGLSMLGVLAYGEVEFVLATIKVIGIVVFFILSIVINVGGAGGDQGYIGFRYFQNPGPFNGSGIDALNGIAKILVVAATLYAGTEATAITAAEARNPAKAVPISIRSVFYRILVLYLGTIFFIGLNVPSDDPQLVSARSKAAASPLTIALKRGGIGAAASLINALIILSVISAGNSSLYIASRTLQSLGATGRAPKIFGWTSARGKVPIPALVLSNLVALISLLSISSGASTVFTYIINISGVSTFIIFAIICFCHIRFRQAWLHQGNTLADLPFKAWLAPYGTWVAFVLNVVLMFFQGYTTFLNPRKAADIVVAYIVIPVAVVLFFGWKWWHKTRMVSLDDIDLVSGRRLIEDFEPEGEGSDETAGKVPWYKNPKKVLSRILA